MYLNDNNKFNSLFSLLKDFCLYDFYFLLRKFNSSIQENTFTSTPNFEKINAEYIPIIKTSFNLYVVNYNIFSQNVKSF